MGKTKHQGEKSGGGGRIRLGAGNTPEPGQSELESGGGQPFPRRIWQAIPRIFFWVMLVCSAGALLFYFTVPVGGCTDTWWHMAVGRTMLEDRTLVFEHDHYSWTPVSNDTIYVAWIAQIGQYLLFESMGVAGLHLFLYGLPLFSCLAYFAVAKRCRVLDYPLVWVAPIFLVLMIHPVPFVKPEGFSLLFLTLTVMLWVCFKMQKVRYRRFAYAIPGVMLLWVNSHGAFLFGMIFLGLATIGEIANLLISYRRRLPRQKMWHWLLAMVLCGTSLIMNPHRFSYFASLWEGLSNPDANLLTIAAFVKVYDPSLSGLRVLEIYFLILAILVTCAVASVTWKRVWLRRGLVLYWIAFVAFFILFYLDPGRSGTRMGEGLFLGWIGFSALLLAGSAGLLVWERRLDVGIWLPILALGVFSTQMVRAIYLGAIPLLFGIPLLLRCAGRSSLPLARQPRLSMLVLLVCAGTLTLTGILIHHRVRHRPSYSWMGWGTDLWAPTEEVDYFLETYPEIDRVGNIYEIGGYLLWRFNRERKVLIDPRAFPYKEWFGEYLLWENMGDPDFLRRYDADAWFISYRFPQQIDWFQNSPEYALATYGAGCVIFVKPERLVEGGSTRMLPGAGNVRSAARAVEMIRYAVNIGDWEGVFLAYGALSRLRDGDGERLREGVRRYLLGNMAHQRGDFAEAAEHLRKAEEMEVLVNSTLLASAYFQMGLAAWEKKAWRESFDLFSKSDEASPGGFEFMYNTGATGWHLMNLGMPVSLSDRDKIKNRLQRILTEGEKAAVGNENYLSVIPYARKLADTMPEFGKHPHPYNPPELLDVSQDAVPLTPVQEKLLEKLRR